MKIYTHEIKRLTKTEAMTNKLTFFFIFAWLYAVSFFCAFNYFKLSTGFFDLSNIFGILFIIIPNCLVLVRLDIKRAYIEINGREIHVVDYYLGIKKEKTFLSDDIDQVELVKARSRRVRGYKLSNIDAVYFVFKNKAGKHMFKAVLSPEARSVFDKYAEIND